MCFLKSIIYDGLMVGLYIHRMPSRILCFVSSILRGVRWGVLLTISIKYMLAIVGPIGLVV